MNTQSPHSSPLERVQVGPPEPPRTLDDERREMLRAAIMKGASNAQVDLLCAIGNRYGLDPLLQHVVLIDGKPYVTHKGLMHIAHVSGQFDGMETTFGADSGGEFAECTVYRKDMSRPFRARIYLSEYNKHRGAWSTHPRAMAAKTGESFCLRRAFDVSLTSQEEMGQHTPVVPRRRPGDPEGEWNPAAKSFAAVVGALDKDARQALKAELTDRFGHCDIRQFTTGELTRLTREVQARMSGPSPTPALEVDEVDPEAGRDIRMPR